MARTIRRFRTETSADPLEMGTTTHAARYRADIWPVLRQSTTLRQASATWWNWDCWRVGCSRGPGNARAFTTSGAMLRNRAHDDWSRLRSLLRFIAQLTRCHVRHQRRAGRACGAQRERGR